MRALPHSASAIHHHGEQNTIVYAVSGNGSVVSEHGKKVRSLLPFSHTLFFFFPHPIFWFDSLLRLSVIYQRVDLKPGDWAMIPAWAEHQEVNDGDEDVVWVIVRSGNIPDVQNLPEGWGSSHVPKNAK